MLTIALAVAGSMYMTPSPSNTADPELERLVGLMVGSFSSEEQSKQDSEFRDIRLSMTRIWTDQAGDGAWLYVEQAVAGTLDKPYRQRIYHVSSMSYPGGDGKAHAMYVSEVWMLPGDPLRFVGADTDATKLNDVTPADLVRKDGCEVLLAPAKDGTFAGSTLGRACPSDRQGATYTTSMVKVDANGLTTWDRGFDDAGTQVWGATKGSYQFKRVRASEPATK